SGKSAVRIEEIRRLVNLDVILEYALRRVTTGDGDRPIRQKQLHVVVEPGESVRSGRRERIRCWIVNLRLQAGGGRVFIERGAAVHQDLAVGQDRSFHLYSGL